MTPIFIPRPLLFRLFLFRAFSSYAYFHWCKYRRGIIVYIEYQGVCPSSELGPPTPYLASKSGSTLAHGTQVGGGVGGFGGPNSDGGTEHRISSTLYVYYNPFLRSIYQYEISQCL